MTTFIIITTGTLIVGTVNVILTDKAQQQGHDDNGGLAYYIGTWVMGIVYTFGNVILKVNGAL